MKKYIIAGIMFFTPFISLAYSIPSTMTPTEYGRYSDYQYIVCELHGTPTATFDSWKLVKYDYTLENCKPYATYGEYYAAAKLEVIRQLKLRGLHYWPTFGFF